MESSLELHGSVFFVGAVLTIFGVFIDCKWRTITPEEIKAHTPPARTAFREESARRSADTILFAAFVALVVDALLVTGSPRSPKSSSPGNSFLVLTVALVAIGLYYGYASEMKKYDVDVAKKKLKTPPDHEGADLMEKAYTKIAYLVGLAGWLGCWAVASLVVGRI